MRVWVAAAVLAALALGSCRGGSEEPAGGGDVRAEPDERLPNAHWVSPRVLSGAQPEGEAGFRELVALGIRTVISVDGSRPDVEGARRAGLRYVHLPIGYDGIPEHRALELAKALCELGGPFYIHCHHGQHRGPAAAAVACVAAGQIDSAQGLKVLQAMGTGPQYLGLWASVRRARRADEAVLRQLKVDFRETAPTPPLVEAMVGLDGAFDRLLACAKAGWKPPPGEPDAEPAHEALGIREILTELLRTGDLAARPEDLRRRMDAARQQAEDLERWLRAGPMGGARDAGEGDRDLAKLRQSCTDCHRRWRNGTGQVR